MLALLPLLLAAAPPEGDEARIEQALTLIRQLQEARALELLAPYLSCAAGERCEQLPADLRARALVYAAIALFEQSDEPGARLRLKQALALDRNAYAPEWVSPRFRALFDEQRPLVIAPAPLVIVKETAAPLGPAGRLGIAAGAVAAASLVSFGVWIGFYSRASAETVALRREGLDATSRPFFYAGEGLAAVAVTLAGTALVWWLMNRSHG